jgi:DNA polymerase bacteriophage-type
MRLSGDFETCSLGNLTRMGAWKYARDPSTRILCFSWAVEDDEPGLWFPPNPPPRRLLKTIEAGCEFHAWNAQFEFNIWNAIAVLYGLPSLPIERFHCSMARALYWGVPPKLEQAAFVVGTNVRKDVKGAALMKKMMKPRAAEGRDIRWWHEDEPDLLINLGEYCQQDVRTERAIARHLKPMPTVERQLWLLDQRMNMRGLRVDLDAVWRMRRVVDSELKRLGGKLAVLTDGAVDSVTQTARLLDWLKGDGVEIDSLGKNVLPLVLKDPLTPRQRQIIEVYQEGAKTSTAKLKAMEEYLHKDGRVRGLVQYGGALRTLRWAGRGVQIQNYPRPSKEIDAKRAIVDILAGVDAEWIELKHGRPMDVVSQCLRGCYVPESGHAFAVADFSAIEARVVAWLAGEEDALNVFRSGADIYVATARAIGSDSRLLGKVLVLACGFGMGPKRFRATAATFGIFLTDEQSKDNVYGWRNLNSETRSLWYTVDDVVRTVISERVTDRWVSAGPHLAFRMGKDGSRLHNCLIMRLPSHRPIIYRNASLDTVLDEDGVELEQVIRYDGLDYTKKWSRIRTWGGKIVENATQATARDLLADAMLRLDDGSDDLDVTIHDELIAEPLISHADERLIQMKTAMSIAPDWASDLPLKAEGAVMMRYGKE